MDKLQIVIYFLLIGFLIFGISFLIEFYKKKIRKDKITHNEVHIVSFILSSLAIVALDRLHVFIPFIHYYFPEAPLWLDYVVGIAIIYILQYQADMKILKNLIKMAALNIISKYGIVLNKEDLDKILKNSNQ